MLAPRKKSYEKPRQHIKKQRHHFTNKGPSSGGMVFPVVMFRCDSWTMKKAECQRIDVFRLWCWRKVLRVLWTAKRSNQSILKKSENESRSVLSNSLWPHEPYLTRLLCPWDFPGKNTGVGCHFLLQGIFLTQGLNLWLKSLTLAGGLFTTSATWLMADWY